MNKLLDAKHKSSYIKGMNKLPLEKRVQILEMLVEGSSMRSIERVANVSINTVTKLLVEAGQAAESFHDATVTRLQSKDVQCDEIWSFCYAKKRNVRAAKNQVYGAGDVWTFTALDRDTKLIVSWFAGDRDGRSADAFMQDVSRRVDTDIQLTTDGYSGYTGAVRKAFGENVDYAQLQKSYSNTPNKSPEARYSPGVCTGAKKIPMTGNPDFDKISTSHVERSNLSMRMGMRRFTRLTNAFSKKFDNHLYALALYFFHYNFCRIHKTLRTSPAQAAGVTDELLSMASLCQIMDAANPQKKRGAYKKVATGHV